VLGVCKGGVAETLYTRLLAEINFL